MQAISSLTKSGGEVADYSVVSVRLPRDLWKMARLEAVETDVTVGVLVEDAIREKLAKRKRKGS